MDPLPRPNHRDILHIHGCDPHLHTNAHVCTQPLGNLWQPTFPTTAATNRVPCPSLRNPNTPSSDAGTPSALVGEGLDLPPTFPPEPSLRPHVNRSRPPSVLPKSAGLSQASHGAGRACLRGSGHRASLGLRQKIPAGGGGSAARRWAFRGLPTNVE